MAVTYKLVISQTVFNSTSIIDFLPGRLALLHILELSHSGLIKKQKNGENGENGEEKQENGENGENGEEKQENGGKCRIGRASAELRKKEQEQEQEQERKSAKWRMKENGRDWERGGGIKKRHDDGRLEVERDIKSHKYEGT